MGIGTEYLDYAGNLSTHSGTGYSARYDGRRTYRMWKDESAYAGKSGYHILFLLYLESQSHLTRISL